MKLSIDRTEGIVVVRVGEPKLMYPVLPTLTESVTKLLAGGESKIVIDMSQVIYLDSASIGCLMDLYPAGVARGGCFEACQCTEACRNNADDDGRSQLHRTAPNRIQCGQELWGVTMRTIKTGSGVALKPDGDLLTVLETLYKELSAQHGLDRTYEDTMREVNHLIDQMTEDEWRAYLIESLFLNTVTYENEKAGAYMRKLTGE